jgi:hypothetical protein
MVGAELRRRRREVVEGWWLVVDGRFELMPGACKALVQVGDFVDQDVAALRQLVTAMATQDVASLCQVRWTATHLRIDLIEKDSTCTKLTDLVNRFQEGPGSEKAKGLELRQELLAAGYWRA